MNTERFAHGILRFVMKLRTLGVHSLILLLTVFSLASCAQISTDTEFAYTANEAPHNPNLYMLHGRVDDEVYGHSTINAEGRSQSVDGFSSSSFRVWQEGKGLIRVRIESITPSLDYAKSGSLVIIKTTDLKVLALQPGDNVVFLCRVDYEFVGALTREQAKNTNLDDARTEEFDICRLQNPVVR